MVESSMTLVNSWRIESEGGVADVRIDEYLRSFSGDVISRACFGSNYSKWKEIFLKLGALQEHMAEKVLSNGIPGIGLILSIVTLDQIFCHCCNYTINTNIMNLQPHFPSHLNKFSLAAANHLGTEMLWL
ncbi:hypothetical protein SLA2020_439800 [Shorea laevis]